MSEAKPITLNLLLRDGVLTLTEVQDLQQRISAIEARFVAQDERITRMLTLLVRLAEQIEGKSS